MKGTFVPNFELNNNAYEKDYTFICSCGAIGSGYIG